MNLTGITLRWLFVEQELLILQLAEQHHRLLLTLQSENRELCLHIQGSSAVELESERKGDEDNEPLSRDEGKENQDLSSGGVVEPSSSILRRPDRTRRDPR